MACVAAFLTCSSAVQADDTAAEAVLGTFESTNAKRAAEGRPATFDFEPATSPAPATSTNAPSAADDDVSRLFADGLDDLESGETAAAQRKFEAVVARDPESHLAKNARGYLADLYRAPAGAVSPQPAMSPQPKFAAGRSALGAADLAAGDKQRVPELPQAGAPVPPGIEEEFIVQAGDRVFFGSGSADLGQRARVVLAAQARWLAQHGEIIATIEGHADDGTMPDAQSAELSERRAVAVRDRLVVEGVAPSRLVIASAGRSQPIANCPGSDCAAQNRRVVTLLKSLPREGSYRGRGPSLASDDKPQPTH